MAADADTPTRRRVSRGTLSRDDILAATLELIEADPDQPITMQRVATALGTRPMSLYTHVRNRDDLIDGVVERSWRAWTVQLADDTRWEQQLRDWCGSLRDHVRRWPPLIEEMTRHGSFQPGLLEQVAVLARVLRRSGLEGRELAEALRWVPQTVLGAIVLELGRPQDLQSADDETAAILGSIAQLSEAARGELLSVIPFYSERDLTDLFDYSVDRLIDGVRDRSARRATGGDHMTTTTEPTERFSTDAVLEEAARRTGGLTDLGEGPFVEPLALFLDSLEREGQLSEIGRLIASERALMHTVNRLGYVQDRKANPTIADERIVAPVFIIGFPRTGSTILHDILAQDPDTRSPLTWETMFPSPPPEAATSDTDPRIELARSILPNPENETEADRQFRAMHPMGAELTQECVTMMGETMCTPLFHNQFRVPTYQDWVDDEADWAHVYRFHRQQLQHLQWRNPRDRWVLKTGAHMWGLEHLLRTYPDARIVFTHRDPVKSVASYASLTCHVRAMGSDHVDRAEVSADWNARLLKAITRTMAVRDGGEFPDATFYDMYFPDFVADQFAVVSDIYDALGLPMTDEAATRMRAFIDDNPQGKHGVHLYTPEEYGIDPAAVRRDFSGYIERYDLAPE